VLGNHDYYGAGIAGVRERMRRLHSSALNWLPAAGCVEIAPGVALVGHGGWGDARLGSFASSPVILTDYLAIADLMEPST
jgi:Icc protein